VVSPSIHDLGKKAFALYNFPRLAHNLCFRQGDAAQTSCEAHEEIPIRVCAGGVADRFPMRRLHNIRLVALLILAASSLHAQQTAPPGAPDQPAAPAPQSAPSAAPAAHPLPVHRFWDRENDLLFAAVGAGRALDYASTLNLRRRGIDEIFLTNSIVDNHPLFGGIEAAATAASIGVSYLFHRTGHHRLERWTSAIHFGVATGGAIRNYALKTPHPI
jgi:hypothetical protein